MEESSEPSDAELVAASRRGDRAAYGRLAERYWRALVSLVAQRTGDLAGAEDASQEALLEGYRKIRSHRRRDQFFGWILRSAYRRADRSKRRESSRRERLRRAHEAGRAANPRADRDPATGDASSLPEWGELLRGLGDDDRRLLTLRFVGDLSAAEIGAALGISAGAVRVRLHRLLERLGRRLPHPSMRVKDDGHEL